MSCRAFKEPKFSTEIFIYSKLRKFLIPGSVKVNQHAQDPQKIKQHCGAQSLILVNSVYEHRAKTC